METNEIKAELIIKGVSITNLAKNLLVSQPFVSQVIHGTRKNTRVRQAIAKAIGKKISEVWPTASQEISQTQGRGK